MNDKIIKKFNEIRERNIDECRNKYFNMELINSECVKCDEVKEIIDNICNFINEVNINNFDEMIKKYEFEIVDFWGGYMGFLKVKYYNKLENLGLFKYF